MNYNEKLRNLTHGLSHSFKLNDDLEVVLKIVNTGSIVDFLRIVFKKLEGQKEVDKNIEAKFDAEDIVILEDVLIKMWKAGVPELDEDLGRQVIVGNLQLFLNEAVPFIGSSLSGKKKVLMKKQGVELS